MTKHLFSCYLHNCFCNVFTDRAKASPSWKINNKQAVYFQDSDEHYITQGYKRLAR